jgi:glycosyltransferase involved in cell wall biosynthesis
LNILVLNNIDAGGGSGSVVGGLVKGLRERGHTAWLAVGKKSEAAPDLLSIPSRPPGIPSYVLASAGLRQRAFVRLGSWLDHPLIAFRNYMGIEDFDFPATYSLLERLPPRRPDLVHLHCVYGTNFDLRALPQLSREIPLVVTLHEAALLTGGCFHPFDCERWRTGCGKCPQRAHLHFRPDSTHWNWKRKREIYRRSRLFLAAPCRWLMEKAEASILSPATVERRVIATGVDLEDFRPGDQAKARDALGVPREAAVVTFVAVEMRSSPYKDYPTLRAAVRAAARQLRRPLVLLAVGQDGPVEREDNLEIRFVPYTPDTKRLALHYQAADVYAHAARAETFPVSVLEALACGRGVIASGVGGIVEQVNGLRRDGDKAAQWNSHPADTATGILVPPEDPEAMASAIVGMLQSGNGSLARRLGENARRDAETRFDRRREADEYIDWYRRICADWRPGQDDNGKSAGAVSLA